MPRKRTGAGGLALSTLAAYFFISVAWAAQPNEHYARPHHAGQRNAAAHRESIREEGPRGIVDAHDLQNHDEKRKQYEFVNTNDGDFELETLSASQTFAPARRGDDGGLAVRAPVPAAAHPSAYISDRSLQDWVMEDLILMATVDGEIHARDRKTGQHRWALSSEDYPMVETTYNRTGLAKDDYLQRMYWIIEPSNDGDIYLYLAGEHPGEEGILQKLGINVKNLVDSSPYSVEKPPLIYNAEKSTSLFSFDAKTGNVLAMYGGKGRTFEDRTTCQMPSPFGGDGLVESECKSEGSITLGRLTYNIWIQRPNGDQLCNIRYSQWIPNQRDRDLHSQYSASMDQSYIYTSWNGRIMSLKHDAETRPLWNQQLPNPVVRVFDVVRPAHTEARDTELVLLPQPVGPASKPDNHRVWVNQTKPESFYALSELNYPRVTDDAKDAKCYDKRVLHSHATSGYKLNDYQTTQSMVGVHRLKLYGKHSKTTNIAPGERLTIEGSLEDPENQSATVATDVPAPPSSSVISNSYIASSFIKNPIDTVILLIVAVISILYLTGRLKIPQQAIQLQNDVPKVSVTTAEQAPELSEVVKPEELPTPDVTDKAVVDDSAPVQVTVPDPEPVKEETIGSAKLASIQEEPDVTPTDDTQAAESVDKTRSRTNSVIEDPSRTPKVRIVEPALSQTSEDPENEEGTPAKKKARRGQRGGKAHRRSKKNVKSEGDTEASGSIDLAVEKALEIGKEQEPPAEIQPDALIPQTGGNPVRVSDNVLRIGNLTVFEDTILGYGSHGTRVFKGTFGGRDVAVKVMLKQFYEVASQEVVLLQESDDHRNVVRYYDKETAGDFLYIALELCPATLAEVTEQPINYPALLGPNGLDRVDALRQITRGIRYLHSLKIVHRDIKPENILVAAGKKRLTQPNVIQPPRMLISDFGLCKKLDVDQSSFRATTAHAAGTSGWRAPELLVDEDNADNTRPSSLPGTQHSTNSEPVVLDTATNRRATRAIDIFALGCIFFYVLSGGNHPFDGAARGEGRYFREVNIIKGRHDLSDLAILGDYRGEAENLISSMIMREPKLRPDAGQILAHPFFWSAAKRLEFLCHVSDQFEFEPRDPPSWNLQNLESIAPAVFREAHGDFMTKLPQAFLSTLAKQRKYQGGRMLDVLRALRNKKNHYEDMPPNVKAMVGSLPEGYLLFWTTRFPLLLMGCHQVVKDCGWHTKDRFREYYEPPTED